jgi:Carbohydrate binding domain
MRASHWIAFAVLNLAATSGLQAQQPTKELQALDDALPGNLVNDPSNMEWNIFGPGVVSKPIKDPSIPGGGGAMQVKSPKAGKNNYDIGANIPITAAIKSGQKFVVAFYAKTVSADTPDGKAKIGVRIQQNAAPYSGFADTVLSIGKDWQLYEVKGTSNINVDKGIAVLNYQLSGAKQVVQIGQTIVVEGADSLNTVTKNAPQTNAAASKMMPNLEGKGKIINDPARTQLWGFYGDGLTQKSVPSKSMPEGTATEVTVSKLGKNVYDSGISIPINEAIAEGDVLTIAFVARTLSADTENGAGKIGLRVQRNAAPYPGFGDNTLSIGPNWKVYQLRTQARMDIVKGMAAVSMQLGGAKQSFEIGSVYVLNAGPPPPKQ